LKWSAFCNEKGRARETGVDQVGGTMMKTADHDGIQQKISLAAELQKEITPAEGLNKSCILMVTNQSEPEPSVMEYVINVADRLGSKILLVCVNTRPYFQTTSRLSRLIISSPSQTIEHIRLKAQKRGVEFECIRETGNISRVIKRLCHIVKRVEFVIVDRKIKMEEATNGSPIPVFSVVSNELHSGQTSRTRQERTFYCGGKSMNATSRKRYFGKTLVFGAMTAALYGAVFAYQEEIMQYWTKGGIYALLPVATVFVFSYAHGSFTGNFWSALGIEGSKASSLKQKTSQATTSDKATKRPDTRPRVQAS
jgi:hypothetical protein